MVTWDKVGVLSCHVSTYTANAIDGYVDWLWVHLRLRVNRAEAAMSLLARALDILDVDESAVEDLFLLARTGTKDRSGSSMKWTVERGFFDRINMVASKLQSSQSAAIRALIELGLRRRPQLRTELFAT